MIRMRCRDAMKADIGREGTEHISVCYIPSSEIEAAKLIVEQNLCVVNGYTFPLRQIELRFPDRVTHVNFSRFFDGGFGSGGTPNSNHDRVIPYIFVNYGRSNLTSYLKSTSRKWKWRWRKKMLHPRWWGMPYSRVS